MRQKIKNFNNYITMQCFLSKLSTHREHILMYPKSFKLFFFIWYIRKIKNHTAYNSIKVRIMRQVFQLRVTPKKVELTTQITNITSGEVSLTF